MPKHFPVKMIAVANAKRAGANTGPFPTTFVFYQWPPPSAPSGAGASGRDCPNMVTERLFGTPA